MALLQLGSPDRVQRHFSLTVLFAGALAVLFVLLDHELLLGSTHVCSGYAVTLLLVALLVGTGDEQGTRKRTVVVAKVVLFLLLMTSVLVFFDGSNVVNRVRFQLYGEELLWDPAWVRLDTLLLGWAFPKGQLSLYLDESVLLGPTSLLGRLSTEVLQVAYVTYYLPGNLLGIYLAYQMAQSKGPTLARKTWRRLQVFLVAWVASYYFNFLLNLIFPTVSPRIYLEDDFKNPLTGIYIAGAFRSAVSSAAANSFSAFPSGHCGMSWLAATLASRLGYKQYARLCSVLAVAITLATQVLRYHYVIDALAAVTVYRFGLFLSGLQTEQDARRTLGIKDESAKGVQLDEVVAERP